uniref:Transmembrane protein n=1 Tax=Strigamia maritima TaxID=126957 RepID=T1IR07_STRMM
MMGLAIIYTVIVILMSAFASIVLFHYAYELSQHPPEILINTWGQTIILQAQIQDESTLWVRIIAVLYTIIFFLAFCSLFSLPASTKQESRCYFVTWLIMHATIDILALVAIIFSHVRNFEVKNLECTSNYNSGCWNFCLDLS